MAYFYMLVWYDDNRKHDTAHKIADGCKAFRERYGVMPTLVQVNPAEYVEIAGIDIQPRDYVQKNNYYVGIVPMHTVTADPSTQHTESVQQSSLFEV